ncbi:hypothetical protein ACJX0J_026129, partial [Zea mays]
LLFKIWILDEKIKISILGLEDLGPYSRMLRFLLPRTHNNRFLLRNRFIGIILDQLTKKCKQKIKMRNAAIKTIWLARAIIKNLKNYIYSENFSGQFLSNDSINARLDMEEWLAFYDFLRSQHQLCARTLNAIWLDSIYSEGIGLHTKKIYMTRWFGIVCLRIHNFASFNEGNQDIEKTIEKQFATCVRKIEGHRIVEHQISHLWNTKHFCNML